MEIEILSELQTIKVLLWVLLGCLFLFVLPILIGNIAKNLQIAETMRRNQFLSTATAYEDKGEFVELANLAGDRLKKYPKDLEALLHLATARLRMNNFQGALDAFSEIKSIDPHWQRYTIDSYLESARESMGGPTKHDT